MASGLNIIGVKTMKKIFQNDWQELLSPEMQKEYYQRLREFLIGEYRSRIIYPDMHDIFNALHLASYHDTKVVILGQDPYHGAGQAQGISFSVKEGIAPPPSLVNIFQELKDDLGLPAPPNGSLLPWARQGVLLLNAVLTVRANAAGSHAGKGWEIFTDYIIELLGKRERPIVFILWGSYARGKKRLISNPRHLIIESPHPSPLSAHRGFFGSRPFSRTNEFLIAAGEAPIDWSL